MAVKVGDKVRCVDNSGTGQGLLIVGKDYEIEFIDQSNGYYWLTGRTGQASWRPNRFVVIPSDPLSGIAALLKKPKVFIDLPKSKTEVDEDKCWELLKPRIDPGYCKCGILQSVCLYHRDNTPAPTYKHIKI